ncbi:natural cytotoxicity triggering receptor 3 ligand 1-like isoform X2 [Dendropsophus ebraccatus]|uniref:natural cytotoxicity triggering receptor 3 ligand 1-like isoform X2 n=1 Tax=Dendropsophus ebraccatus TaxID=150705 RepID=UPI0038311DB9
MADTQITVRRLLLMMGVILLTLLHPAAGRLRIRRTESPIEALAGHNTILPCLFYGYEMSPLDLSMVSVRWTLTTFKRKEEPVCWFHGGDHIQTRPGSYIPDSRLMGGDGSLYIPNIQPSDDGEYTCTVIVTPEKAISKVTMEVSAAPTCTVSDSKLEMYPDTERSVTCYVSGFYPQPVTIHWVKYSNRSSKKSKLNRWIYTSIPARNRDGTYDISSELSVRPMSTEENGDVYSCVISHRSLRDPLTCNVTISVHPVPENIPRIAAIVLFLLFMLLSVVLLIMYRVYVKKDVYDGAQRFKVQPVRDPISKELTTQVTDQ